MDPQDGRLCHSLADRLAGGGRPWVSEDAVLRDCADSLAAQLRCRHLALDAEFELVGPDEPFRDGQYDRRLRGAGVNDWSSQSGRIVSIKVSSGIVIVPENSM